MVIKTLKAWLKPDPGMYKLINNEVICYSVDTGKQLRMEKVSKLNWLGLMMIKSL